MADWLKNKKNDVGLDLYPECSHCGYHWITQCYGEYNKENGNLLSALYCPNCGSRMFRIVDVVTNKAVWLNKEAQNECSS